MFNFNEQKQIEALADTSPLDYICGYVKGIESDIELINETNAAEFVLYYRGLQNEFHRQISILIAGINNVGSIADIARWTHDINAAIRDLSQYIPMLAEFTVDGKRNMLFPYIVQFKPVILKSIVKFNQVLENLKDYNPEDTTIDIVRFASSLDAFNFSVYAYPEVNSQDMIKVEVEVADYLLKSPLIVSNLSNVIFQQNILELIINAVKYGARNLTVKFVYVSGVLMVRIDDDGTGFEDGRRTDTLAAIEKLDDTTLGSHAGRSTSTGKGLVAMARAGFEIKIIPHPNHGTTILAGLLLDVPRMQNLNSSSADES